jgi:hypothetical protein
MAELLGAVVTAAGVCNRYMRDTAVFLGENETGNERLVCLCSLYF